MSLHDGKQYESFSIDVSIRQEVLGGVSLIGDFILLDEKNVAGSNQARPGPDLAWQGRDGTGIDPALSPPTCLSTKSIELQDSSVFALCLGLRSVLVHWLIDNWRSKLSLTSIIRSTLYDRH